MADFSAPSFSLGLDLDVDPDLSTEEEPECSDGGRHNGPKEGGRPLVGASPSRCAFWVEEEQEEEYFVVGTIEEDPPLGTPALKRLRRGPRGPPPLRPLVAGRSTPASSVRFPAVDDDIEEILSQEDCVIQDGYSSRRNFSACSSSKFSLHGQRLFTNVYARKLKVPKTAPPTNGSLSLSLKVSSSKNEFESLTMASSSKKVSPRLTISPLRRFQSVESDSDDLSFCGDEGKDATEVDACHKESWFPSAHSVAGAQKKRTKISLCKLKNESLWKETSSKKNVNLATPILDELREEYFRDMKSSNADQWSKDKTSITSSCMHVLDDGGADNCHEKTCTFSVPEHNWNLPGSQPPSYQYFYHCDLRIQKLVRQRLPNFIPLVDLKGIEKQHANAETIDYMSQFGQSKEPFQVSRACGKVFEGSSRRRPETQNYTNGKEVANVSCTWVNPRSRNAVAKHAGKKRVHAQGCSGHWYTGQDGRKVYVTRNGQELSGKIAYRRYRKESGGRFQKSRKKAGTAKRKQKR